MQVVTLTDDNNFIVEMFWLKEKNEMGRMMNTCRMMKTQLWNMLKNAKKMGVEQYFVNFSALSGTLYFESLKLGLLCKKNDIYQ